MKKTFLFLALLLAGCASDKPEGPTVTAANPQSPETAGAPAVLLDQGMDGVIAVDRIRIGHNPHHYLTVQANIRNRTPQDQEIQVQTLFFDAFGNALGDEAGNPTAWSTIPITANETVPYRAQAISEKAVRATIRIRFLHRSS